MIEALQFEFVRTALFAGILVSIACGIMGSLIVINRMVFVSGGIAHAAYGGIGLALLIGIPPIVGAGLFSVVIAIVIGALTLAAPHRSDTVIGALWAAGMAAGILMTDLAPGYNVDLMSYLFGSILTIPAHDLWIIMILDAVIAVFVMLCYRPLLALSFDREFAGLRGVPAKALYFAVLILAALTIVMTIRLVGLILVIALLTIPIRMAERHVGSLWRMMILAAVGSACFSVIGLWFSFRFNITSGASIILVATTAFFLHELALRYIRSNN